MFSGLNITALLSKKYRWTTRRSRTIRTGIQNWGRCEQSGNFIGNPAKRIFNETKRWNALAGIDLSAFATNVKTDKRNPEERDDTENEDR